MMEKRKKRAYSSWLLERIATGDVIRLCLGTSSMGRHASRIITIPDSAYVSSNHAEIIIAEDDTKVEIKDLNSVNGIWVNQVRYHGRDTETIELKAMDRIGIGVSDDTELDPIYPVFLLKYAPLRRATSTSGPAPNMGKENLLKPKLESIDYENNNETSTSRAASCPANTTQNDKSTPPLLAGTIIILSDDENDDDTQYHNTNVTNDDGQMLISKDNMKSLEVVNKSSVTAATSTSNAESNTTLVRTATSTNTAVTNIVPTTSDSSIHVPIASNIKQELVRSLSADIQTIFGETDDVILDSVRDINPYLYKNMNGKLIQMGSTTNRHKSLVNGDHIDLVSDDENDQIQTTKTNRSNSVEKESAIGKEPSNYKERIESPNIFDGSLDSTNGKGITDEAATAESTSTIALLTHTKSVDNAKPDEAEDESYEFFSQVLVNDMKSEMADEPSVEVADDNDYENELDEGETIAPVVMRIKCEPVESTVTHAAPKKDMDSSSWIISDEDDYDEDLEHKVSGWTNKLFSQNLSQMNMSQVFEVEDDYNDDEDDADADKDSNDDSDFFDNDFYNCQLDDAAKIVDDVVASLTGNNMQVGDQQEEKCIEMKTLSPEPEKSQKTKEPDVEPKSAEHTGEPNKRQKDGEFALTDVSLTKNDIAECDGQAVNTPQLRNSLLKNVSVTTLKERRKSLSAEIASIVESKESTRAKSIEKEGVKETNNKLDQIKVKHHRPQLIDAPQLPTHKGKLRGVSAESSAPKTSKIGKKLETVREAIKSDNYNKELKRKWLEKPNDVKRRDKERKRIIKESRKERLRELANKSVTEVTEGLLKRKLPQVEECDIKKPKIKITTVNRGAFLAKEVPKEQKTYKIPKSNNSNRVKAAEKKCKETDDDSSISSDNKKSKQLDMFAQEISKPDELLIKRQPAEPFVHTKSADRQLKLTMTVEPSIAAEPRKDAISARAQRTTNKITFASMQKNFIESRKNHELLQQICSAKRSCLTDIAVRDANKTRTKKTVRFNDEPIVYYIERKVGATKKVDKKDILPQPTFNDRQHNVRSTYKIVDNTNEIISQILSWSNEWLVKRNAEVDAASDIVLPMPNQFTSINQYKSIIFPLMKLEFISMLEREYSRSQPKPFTVSLLNVTENNCRLMLITKGKFRNNGEPRCELALLDCGRNRTFAYISAKRLTGNFSTVVFEIIAKDVSIEKLRSIREINVRPVVDNMRVEFGAFNAVYQLESTPLFNKILNPLELYKCKPPPKRKITYKGFDKLNEQQQQVLLSTYAKAIEPTPNITLIQGPPGTGKSCVITNLVLQLLYGNEVRCMDQKVLICAQSNAAVDVIAEKLFHISQKMRPDIMFRLIRYGVLERINVKVQPASLQKVVERNQLRKLKAAYKDLQVNSNENVKDYLRSEMRQLEAYIEDIKLRNIKDTVEEEELHEKQRQLQLMRNIVNGSMRPEDERSIYSWYLANANVICATLSSCVKLSQYVNYFDICIIDEATQCTEPWTLLPLKFGVNSLILVGDTQQLPATVLSKKAYDFGLGTSLFTRIQNCIESVTKDNNGTASTSASSTIFSLKTQYRMHPEICKWPNSYFYKNELINAPITQQYKTPIMPFSMLNLQYTQNENCVNGQIINEMEVRFVVKLVKALDAYIPMNYNTYGVITPYAQQRFALESAMKHALLSNVMVNTIDSYQGMERDVIIISNARTSGIGFLAHYQRLNVALTRPKKCLIMCGSFKNLESVPTWRSLLKSARERNLLHEISADCFDDIQKNVIDKIKIRANQYA